MIEGSLGLIVEGMVSVLLVATIFYCISVNRKLERLRHEQKGMYDFIRELSLATNNADKAIKGLRETVQASGAELASQIDKGQAMTRQLKSEIENAGQAMKKLVVLTNSASRLDKMGQGSAAPLAGAQEPLASLEHLRDQMPGFEDVDLAEPASLTMEPQGRGAMEMPMETGMVR